MAPPPTQNEQLALDELLNDIYRGIETLPDSNQAAPITTTTKTIGNNKYNITHYNQQVKHYELPSSSPIVQHHKREIAALRNKQQPNDYPAHASPYQQQQQQQQQQQPDRSSLKRQKQHEQHQHHEQSLASFIKADLAAAGNQQQQHQGDNFTGSTKRRVRIVEHPEKLAKQQREIEQQQQQQPQHQYRGSPYARFEGDPQTGKGVKYVNTNQLIYHEEPPSKWNNEHDTVYTPVIDQDVLDQYSDDGQEAYKAGISSKYRAPVTNEDAGDDDDDDDLVDGTTRVEYYRTSWLDRQLGRASKRRSSKELNERQVKEKAMIEELKRSLKNGAITLKRSLKGKSNKHSPTTDGNNLHHHQQSGQYLITSSADDQLNSYTDRPAHRAAASNPASIFATIPRKPNNNNTSYYQTEPRFLQQTTTFVDTAPDQDSATFRSSPNLYNPSSSSTTAAAPAPSKHQLIQSHYSRPIASPRHQQQQQYSNTLQPSHHHQQQQQRSTPVLSTPTSNSHVNNNNNMRYPQSSTLCNKPTINNNQQQQQQYNTISRIPSATEVVKSALESSKSHQEDQRLRKTINALDTPSPYPNSPQTPTHQLKAASPSLSPSPARSPAICGTPMANAHYFQTTATTTTTNTQTMNDSNSLINTNQPILRGTRIIPAPTQPQMDLNRKQPMHVNPHASLMQQRAEQQARSATGGAYRGANQASIREFNELDSLLRSLTTTHTTTPGAYSTPASSRNQQNFNNNPASPAACAASPAAGSGFGSTQINPGYSSRPAQATLGGYGGTFPAQQQQQHQSDPYASVHRNQPTGAAHPMRPLQQSNLSNSNFTLDVTDNASTLERQRQIQAPQLEILPSMEDYQNISKLNPVRNHYWYKPNMSRDRAIALLKDKPQGTFIVRDSNSFKGAYGLAVKVAKLPQNVLNNSSLRDPNNSGDPSNELIRHFLIEPTANGVRLKGYANEPVFGSLPNLIYQHSLTELALPCRLIIPRADIEDPQFNLKQKQFFQEFLASKEEAKHLPYERTSPDGGYRRYPGNVLVHNEHRIIFQ